MKTFLKALALCFVATGAQVQRYSTAGANLQAENDNDWPAFANDNLPLIVKIASGEWR